jgi:hypothetical protein
MARTVIAVTSALLALVAWTGRARADVFIRAPFVSVWVGAVGCGGWSGVRVRAPFVDVQVPRVDRVILPQKAPAEILPPPLGQEQSSTLEELPEPQASRVQPLTIAEFAAAFKPAQGTYEVVFVGEVFFLLAKFAFQSLVTYSC